MARNQGVGGTSNRSRGIFAGGQPGPSNVMDYITIASTGDAADFGDLSAARTNASMNSDAHGGL